MIGIVPSASSTFEVIGDFNSDALVEGKLYYDPKDKRLYLYSLTDKRSNPKNGFFPIWDGVNTYTTKYSNEKFLDKDVVTPSISAMSKSINKDIARNIQYRQRLSEDNHKLYPVLNEEDNMFTQLVKSIIQKLDVTKVDLLEGANDFVDDRMVESYYTSLNKVTMMRLEKFHLWIDKIFQMHYVVTVQKDGKTILTYTWPKNKFDTGIVKYTTAVKQDDDPFKKIVKILMVMNNISKTTLKTEEVDDYTINNMMTVLNSNKSLSAQLFCRFMRMANFSFSVEVFNKKNEPMSSYKE